MRPSIEATTSPRYHVGAGTLALFPVSLLFIADVWSLSLRPFKGAPEGFPSVYRALSYVNAWSVPGAILITLLVVGVFIGFAHAASRH